MIDLIKRAFEESSGGGPSATVRGFGSRLTPAMSRGSVSLPTIRIKPAPEKSFSKKLLGRTYKMSTLDDKRSLRTISEVTRTMSRNS